MILYASLLLAFGVSTFVLTKVVGLLHAKKAEMQHVLVASITGMAGALLTYFLIKTLMKGLPILLMVILVVTCVFVVFAFSFKTINNMSWSSAFTATVANIALVLLTTTIAVVLNKISLDNAIDTVQTTLNFNGEPSKNINTDQAQNQDSFDEEIQTSFKEIDLLPTAAIQEIKAKSKKVYREPKYQIVSLSNARTTVGKNIRIISKSGKTIQGAMKKVSANDVTIEQRTSKGIFIASINLSKIKSLEVYK